MHLNSGFRVIHKEGEEEETSITGRPTGAEGR